MLNKTMHQQMRKEFDVNGKDKPLIIVANWAAPRKSNSFKKKIEMPTIRRFSEENSS